MKSDDNELFLRKLAEYYGYEFKVIDLNKFHTYEKIIRCDKKKKFKNRDFSFYDDNFNFVAFFAKNNAVVICSCQSKSKRDAIANLKFAYMGKYSYNALEFNYASRASFNLMENDWLNASSASEVEMHIALRKG